MRAGQGHLQPDKAGSFGAELAMLYKMTGERKYVKAAVGIANTPAARVQPGDAANSPWPFRVHAVTGEVHRETKRWGPFFEDIPTSTPSDTEINAIPLLWIRTARIAIRATIFG